MSSATRPLDFIDFLTLPPPLPTLPTPPDLPELPRFNTSSLSLKGSEELAIAWVGWLQTNLQTIQTIFQSVRQLALNTEENAEKAKESIESKKISNAKQAARSHDLFITTKKSNASSQETRVLSKNQADRLINLSITTNKRLLKTLELIHSLYQHFLKIRHLNTYIKTSYPASSNEIWHQNLNYSITTFANYFETFRIHSNGTKIDPSSDDMSRFLKFQTIAWQSKDPGFQHRSYELLTQ